MSDLSEMMQIERRLTRLEDRFEVAGREFEARIRTLEDEAEQARVTREQADRAAQGALRQELEAAKAEAAKLRDAAAVDAAAKAVQNGGGKK